MKFTEFEDHKIKSSKDFNVYRTGNKIISSISFSSANYSKYLRSSVGSWNCNEMDSEETNFTIG